jgi:hypothetical protein
MAVSTFLRRRFAMEVDYLKGLEWRLGPAPDTLAVGSAEPESMPNGLTETINNKMPVSEIAGKYNWKVGRKEVRVIRHGGLLDHPIEEKGWILMNAIDYEGIVPQEALDRVRILIREGVEIRGLVIADDLRKYKPGILERAARPAIDRVRAIEWQKHRATITECCSVSASAVASIASAIGARMKDKAEEINWSEVRSVLWSGVKAVAIVSAVIAVAALALPLLALAAVPAALITVDPWLIVVDSENRWWVVAEWWD